MWKSHSADTKYHLLLLVLVLSFSDTHHVKAEVLDQSFIASPQNLIAGIGPSIQEAQTFRVGITGSLTGVDVFLEIQGSLPPPGTFFLDVRPTIADVPVEDDTMLLASTTLPTSVFPLVSFGLGEVG